MVQEDAEIIGRKNRFSFSRSSHTIPSHPIPSIL